MPCCKGCSGLPLSPQPGGSPTGPVRAAASRDALRGVAGNSEGRRGEARNRSCEAEAHVACGPAYVLDSLERVQLQDLKPRRDWNRHPGRPTAHSAPEWLIEHGMGVGWPSGERLGQSVSRDDVPCSRCFAVFRAQSIRPYPHRALGRVPCLDERHGQPQETWCWRESWTSSRCTGGLARSSLERAAGVVCTLSHRLQGSITARKSLLAGSTLPGLGMSATWRSHLPKNTAAMTSLPLAASRAALPGAVPRLPYAPEAGQRCGQLLRSRRVPAPGIRCDGELSPGGTESAIHG